jgi:hypothetical protein
MTTGMANVLWKEFEEHQRGCPHEKLHFGSGGYYIICSECDMRWVAIKTTASDSDLDHGRANLGPKQYKIISDDNK